jgi:glucose/arabinose dehydrogenase
LAILVLVLLLTGSSEAFAALRTQSIATGLSAPTSITHAGDGSGRLFITLQAGRIVIFNGARILPRPFLDISSLVSCCGERGLLSVAFHPNYSATGFFFVNYTNTQGDTVVARYRVSENPNVANEGSAEIILSVRQPFANHNGGQLQFGPDGFLYIGLGDGGSGGDPANRAQDLGELLGKILRINVNGRLPYTIPADNPFVGRPGARPEIWALGLRNPWRFSFDRQTGQLFIADVGQQRWEEVNLQGSNSRGGENYGWRLMEGKHCFNPSTGCNGGALRLPILEYNHTQGCSVTGGYRYRGARVPRLRGTYLFADFCSGRIWGARAVRGRGWAMSLLRDSNAQISTFGEDERGEVYFADHGTGTIFRITGFVP